MVAISGSTALQAVRDHERIEPGQNVLITGGESDGRWLGGTDRQTRAIVLSVFVGQKLGTFISSPNHEDLIEAGKVKPVIDRTYPLSDTPQAIRYLKEGRARGKVVITM